jgi:hypothetical protein
MEKDSPKLYDDYFDVDEFTFVREGFNDKRGFLSYQLLLRAKISLLQNKNITALLSKILQQEIVATYMENSEMTKGVKRPWAIIFPYKDNMYFSRSTNAVSSFQNGETALLLFDLDRKIEFVLGYK